MEASKNNVSKFEVMVVVFQIEYTAKRCNISTPIIWYREN